MAGLVSERREGLMDYEDLEPTVPYGTALAMLLSVLVGVVAAVVLIPSWAPELAASLFGSSPKAYWYLSRTSAFAAYGLLWVSMAMGMTITNRLARLWPGGPAAFELHQYSSLLGLNLALFHALILLGDRFIDYQLRQLLVPFGSVNYEPLAVGVGQIAFYALILVSLSFYVRKRIGHTLWRLLHYFSFLTYALVFVHGLLSGTDTNSVIGLGIYAASGISLLFLLVYRLLTMVFPLERVARSRGASQ